MSDGQDDARSTASAASEFGRSSAEAHNSLPSSDESPVFYDGDSQSVNNSVYEFPMENGRTYHGYRAGTYNFPNDANETDRLDFQFEILKFAFRGRNYFAPLKDPKAILDIGTGTGQWAIEMGDQFPGAKVQGVDLSPIQPSSVPENVHFYIDDASDDDWAVPPNHFDYIHTRMLLGAFTDFKEIIRKSFYHLKPGGWMESQEVMTMPHCDDGTMPEDWRFLEWTIYGERAAVECGRTLEVAGNLKKWYEEVGFVDVREEIIKLPLNGWPDDKHSKLLGRMSAENLLAGLSAFSMGLFSRSLGWSKEAIEVYLVDVRKALLDKSVHAYHDIFVVWGRRPDSPAP